MTTDFASRFSFCPAQYFIQLRRITYQRQLMTDGMLTKVDESQIHQHLFNNTFAALYPQLKKGFGHIYALHLHSQTDGFHFSRYPDLAITGPYDQTFLAKSGVFWPNPYVIVEVLCPLRHSSTLRPFDKLRAPQAQGIASSPTAQCKQNQEREDKFKLFGQIATLREYVRIDPTCRLIEHFVKQPTTEWKRVQIENGEETVHLTSINCRLSLAAVYDQVEIGAA